MKRSICVLLFLVFFLGCGRSGGEINSITTANTSIHTDEYTDQSIILDSEESEKNIESKLPDRIDLLFTPLQLSEMQQGEPSPEWNYIKTMEFGQIDETDAFLDIYDIDGSIESPHQINGVLRYNNKHLVIADLSTTLTEDAMDQCSQVCLFQKSFSNQNRFELIGSIDASLNGPGFNIYILYDVIDSKVLTFDAWGDPSFIDLDNDGHDEFIIEFKGLHLAWPDLKIIRTTNEELEISTSIFNTIQKNEGDLAELNKDTKPLLISISNVHSENEPIINYAYRNGILERISKTN